MALTTTSAIPGEMNYGGFADAIGGIATVVLAIIALSGTHADLLIPIAIIVFGAALMLQAGTMLSEYTHISFPTETSSVSVEDFRGGGLSMLFLAGAAGIILGVLALIGIAPVILTAIAAIVFGGSLVVSSTAVWHLHVVKHAARRAAMSPDWRQWSEILAGQMASGSAGMQAMAGLAAVVLGILAVIGTFPAVLTLVALLVMGVTIVLTGAELSGAVTGFMRPSMERMTHGTSHAVSDLR
jgi:hypothetical protein